jgi:hypothetical protein
MLEIEDIQEITSKFGLDTLICKEHILRDKDGKEIERLRLLSYWIAEIRYSQYPWKNIIVSVAHTSRWHKGVIIIRPLSNGSKSKPRWSLQPIDLIDWHDPVKTALQSVNLLVEDTTWLVDGNSYTLQIGTTLMSTEIDFKPSATGDTSHENLWNSLTLAIHSMVNIYNVDELNKFLTL